MRVFIGNRRKDGKFPVRYVFEHGRTLNKVETVDQIRAFLVKAPDADVRASGATCSLVELLGAKP